MKILLFGEYSNVHATLADGLRALGHTVTVASNGDFWKNYPRDIDLKRTNGKAGGLLLAAKITANLPRFSDYDIVQLINPLFVELKACHHFRLFRYLKRHNKKVVLGAFGMDYYWVNENITRKPLRYSDFNIGKRLRVTQDAALARHDWIGTDKERLNRLCAEQSDAIVTGLYEYDVCYRHNFPQKTIFIPLPIKISATVPGTAAPENKSVIFAGISRNRSAYKGTDIMLRAAREIASRYPDRVELRTVEGAPFEKYCELQSGADIILDQLYSYTPAMNALQAMSRGIVCVGGGEPENYTILGEEELHPIINVEPSFQSVYDALEHIVLDKERLQALKRQSREYVKRHHDHIAVARRYEKLYSSLLATGQ